MRDVKYDPVTMNLTFIGVICNPASSLPESIEGGEKLNQREWERGNRGERREQTTKLG
jgi:hypothetical protein